MAEDQERPPATPAGSAGPAGDSVNDSAFTDAAFARPDGVPGSFADRPHPAAEPRHTPPVAPGDQQRYGRPDGAGGFDAPDGARLRPEAPRRPPVSPIIAATYGPTDTSTPDGFEPLPGTRISPRHPGRRGETPEELKLWSNRDTRDYWLGRGAVFNRGRPMQLHPAQDSATFDPLAGVDDDIPDEPPSIEGGDVSEEEPQEQAGGKRRRFTGRIGLSTIGLMALVAIIAGALGGGVGYALTHRADGLLHKGNVKLAEGGTPANRPPGSVADIAKRVSPAVVSIAVSSSEAYGVGSGVVIDKAGYVLTNNHVVTLGGSSPAASIVVTFSDQSTAKAKVVGTDPVSDLAVLKVPTSKLTVARLGNSSALAVGDPVVAIGSPLGLQGTVTSGIVSALNRPVHVGDESGSSTAYLDAIQTDAPINPGNSGGALVAADSSVIGINSAGATLSNGQGGTSAADGIGYAIPINYARDIAEQLIKTGKAQHGSLGVTGRTATDGTQRGAYLAQVDPNGAAGKAGLRAGDIIVAAGGQSIESYDELVVRIQERKPGDSLSITYLRGGSSTTVNVTLGSS